MKQLESIYDDYVSKRNVQYVCLWILVVTRASLDVIMSVAASVILSLLLISGDVEENPGPGGMRLFILGYTFLRDMNVHFCRSGLQ